MGHLTYGAVERVIVSGSLAQKNGLSPEGVDDTKIQVDVIPGFFKVFFAPIRFQNK